MAHAIDPAPLTPRRRGPLALELAAAIAAGALHSLPFVHTRAWGLQLILIGVLAWRVGDARPARAAALGWAFGVGWLVSGTWWLYISLHDHGGLPAPIAILAVVALAAFLSLYLAAAMAAFARWRTQALARDAVLFAACWLLAELARGVLFTGFPWVASGYAQVDAPLAALAPWLGVYGLGAVMAALVAGVGLARSWPQRAAAAATGAAALLALAGLGPGEHSRPAGRLQVALIQTNVAQDDKFAADRMPEAMQWLSTQLLAVSVDLAVAPETAIPVLPGDLDAGYWEGLRRHYGEPHRAALIGRPLGSYEEGYTNSVSGLSAPLDSPEYRYDKHHLVPFGEFIPTGFHWFTEMMHIPLGDFARGPLVAPSFEVHGSDGTVQRVAPNICYEDLFGEALAARFTDPATAPTVFANVSNIAWFGDSSAVAQHLHISRMRTLELQRPMLRATNTGATVIIDHQGHVTASLAPFTRGVLEGRVEGREGRTPFARWASVAGLWPLTLGALAILAGAAASARRRGRGRPST